MRSLFYTSIFFFLFPFVAGKQDKTANVSALHPFHMAVLEGNYNNKDKSLEISGKFFADDFEQAIEKNYKTSLDIAAGKDKVLFDKYIPDYMNKHLVFTIDGKHVSLNYLGYQTEKEWVHCFFSMSNIGSVKKLDIVNNLLHDFTTDQINIMHITINGRRQSASLNYPAANVSFGF